MERPVRCGSPSSKHRWHLRTMPDRTHKHDRGGEHICPSCGASIHISLLESSSAESVEHAPESEAAGSSAKKHHGKRRGQTNVKNSSPWLTTKEAAAYMKCSVRKLEGITSAGLLPFRRKDPTAPKSPRLYHEKYLTAYLVIGRNYSSERLTAAEKREMEELLR